MLLTDWMRTEFESVFDGRLSCRGATGLLFGEATFDGFPQVVAFQIDLCNPAISSHEEQRRNGADAVFLSGLSDLLGFADHSPRQLCSCLKRLHRVA